MRNVPMKEYHYNQLEHALRFSKAGEPVQIICSDKKWFKTCQSFIEYFKEVHPSKDLSLITLARDRNIPENSDEELTKVVYIEPCEIKKEKVKLKGDKSAR